MVLLDTNVVSYFFRRDSRAADYEAALLGQVRGIAHVTLAELYKWPLERGWGERRRLELDAYLASHAVPLATHNRKHFEHIPGLEIIGFAPS